MSPSFEAVVRRCSTISFSEKLQKFQRKATAVKSSVDEIAGGEPATFLYKHSSTIAFLRILQLFLKVNNKEARTTPIAVILLSLLFSSNTF